MLQVGQLAFHVLVLGCHLFDAVMLLVLNLHNIALVATVDSKLAAGLMLSRVLLVKLSLTAIVDTLEHGVAALVLMLGQIAVG